MSLSLITIHRAMLIAKERQSTRPGFWLILYLGGVVIGLTGLITEVVRNWAQRTRAMEIICGVFGGIVILAIVAALALFMLMIISENEDEKESRWFNFSVTWIGTLTAAVTVTGILTALWSDWILAAIEVKEGGSWAGLPSSDIAWLYWGYFAAKRLPFFSI
ncbi:MAG: hypothetical protein Q9227_005002 [Pyrenula ochraceoflavens]